MFITTQFVHLKSSSNTPSCYRERERDFSSAKRLNIYKCVVATLWLVSWDFRLIKTLWLIQNFKHPQKFPPFPTESNFLSVGKAFNMEKTLPCIIIHGSGISHHCYDGVCFITQFKFLSAYSTNLVMAIIMPHLSDFFFPFSLDHSEMLLLS